jgi:hypothetical protein
VLGRSQQRTLYEKAHAQPIGLDHFVNGGPPRSEVIHDGLNTLPVPTPFRRFQKRFCRPDRDGGRLYGYNEGITRKLIGPGYFVAVPTKGRPSWEARGPVVIDYFQVPDGEVVDGWPRVVENDSTSRSAPPTSASAPSITTSSSAAAIDRRAARVRAPEGTWHIL